MPLVLKYVPVRMLKVLQVAVNLLCGICRPVAPVWLEASSQRLLVRAWQSDGEARGDEENTAVM